jgi:DNA-binding response OmpR family regulator
MSGLSAAVVRKVLGLPRHEARIVAVLAANVGNVVPRDTLCSAFRVSDPTLRVYVSRARSRLVALGLPEDSISAFQGFGYRASEELCRWVRVLMRGYEKKAAA